MASRTGTLVISPVRIADDTIPYPVVYSSEVEGGAQSGALLTDRNSIATWHRRWGMSFRIYNDTDPNNNGLYVLVYNNVDTNIDNNANWMLKAEGGIKKISSTSAVNFSVAIPAGLIYMIILTPVSDLASAGVGYAFGQNELISLQPIYTGENPFNIGRPIASTRNIYFNGITASTQVDIIMFTF